VIENALFALLNTRFPDRGIRLDARGSVVVPAAHPGVGDVTIMDDADELTVYVGDITHGHFASAAEVAEFLESLFADRVLMWKVWTGGGWRLEPEPVTSITGFTLRRWYVWSRPLKP
jgi:hypothetical protein